MWLPLPVRTVFSAPDTFSVGPLRGKGRAQMRRGKQGWVAASAVAVLAVGLLPTTSAWAQPGAEQAGTAVNATESGSSSRSLPGGDDPSKVEQPDTVLPKDWRTSGDRAVAVVGDAEGLHVLAADSSKAYQWQEVAALREDGFESDAWIGNVCVTGSGKRAVVAYAPRSFTNKPMLFDRGAFAAVVDLETRKVTKLNRQVSLAYFNPGCGTGRSPCSPRPPIRRRARPGF